MERTLTFRGRLPGVVCEAALPPSSEVSVQLDVAAFVGFAERGPLDLPVAVEDISQYHEIFGGDLLLARTRLGGQPVFAALPQAVRAFFDNGGRRCYVVRVAGESASPNRFRLPGLVVWQKGQDFQTLIAPAAWSGRWSDTMSVHTQLLSRPLRYSKQAPIHWSENALALDLQLPARTTVRPGDLLRLQFDNTGKPVVYCFADTVTPTGQATSTTSGIAITITMQQDTMQQFSKDISTRFPLPVSVERREKASDSTQEEEWEPLSASALTLEDLPGTDASYRLQMTTSTSLNAGNVLRVHCIQGEILRFPVTDVAEDRSTISLTSHTPSWLLSPTLIERLEEQQWVTLPVQPPFLKLQVGQNREASFSVSNAAIAAMISTGDLLRITVQDGRQLFFPVTDIFRQPPGAGVEKEWSIVSQETLWRFSSLSPESSHTLLKVDLLSFDLSIREGQQTQEVWPDLRFGAGSGYWLDRLVPPLATLQANLLQPVTIQQQIPGLNPALSARLGTPTLLSNGASMSPYYFLPLGMHELTRPDDFTGPLLDAFSASDGLESFDPQALFLDHRLASTGVRDLLNETYQLLYQQASGIRVEPLRKLHSLLLIDEIGMIALPDLIQRKWSPAPPENREQIITAPVTPPEPEIDWSQFHDCKRPAETPRASTRMQLAAPQVPADPPEQIPKLPVIQAPEEYMMDDLLVVQNALIKLCAARADVLAIVSLPLHFKGAESIEWQHRLAGSQDSFFGSENGGFADDTVLSYAAVYHPWLQIREETLPQLAPLRAMPPDGAVCGMIAARELRRGPWIAPANVPLQGVVGLTPLFSAGEWADLFNAQINLIRQPPGQFMLLSAHTLSADTQLLQISVRRLLIFLRKLALHQGMRYVFEANNERFRKAVQANFESILTALTTRGALTAFEVVTSSEINTPNDFDNGRFLIALKVAPTQPVEFITVVLLRAGEGLLEAIER